MRAIDEEAAHWVALRASVPDSQRAGVQAQLDQWLAADPRHKGAFVRAQAVWYELDRLTALSVGTRPRVSASQPLISRRLLLFAGMSIAATAAGRWYFLHGERPPPELTYQSRIGEIRNVRLCDGSRVVLNTDSRATVRIGKRRREVNLAAGEAFFQVASDARAFVVRAGEVLVRATGTAFAVRRHGENAEVTVTEGAVELAYGTETPTRPVGVDNFATIAAGGAVTLQRISPEEAARRLAWREGRIAFAGEPLGIAVAEINRHNPIHIVLDVPTIAALPIIGNFEANDVETFAQVTAAAFDLRVDRRGDLIHLGPARPDIN